MGFQQKILSSKNKITLISGILGSRILSVDGPMALL
ncbi:hypothetical protein BW727_101071 [Jeotgalibaca dankookensis]|uniref:Uncharacterized protein n=1 Tax=Jeotgalibaca dankookensis TaxID=708126 RepID=A0A1S6IPG1_9LACT|nr:hypothetical protein BW727_101071 [Jeotgalibaca dankookensis]